LHERDRNRAQPVSARTVPRVRWPASARHNAFYELLAAFDGPGCALCRITRRSGARLLAEISFESVNDREVRDRLRRSRGLCSWHAWDLLDDTRDPYGAAFIYHDVLHAILVEADAGADITRQESPCLICDAVAAAERRNLGILLEDVEAAELRQHLVASGGLCRSHFRSALLTGGRSVVNVLESQREVLRGASRPGWAPTGALPDPRTASVRAGGARHRRPADDVPAEPLVLLLAGPRPMHWTAGDLNFAATRCVSCRHGAEAAYEVIDRVAPGAPLCSSHLWVMLDRRGPQVARALVEPTAAALSSTIEDLGEQVVRAKTLRLGPLAIRLPAAEQALRAIQQRVGSVADCVACKEFREVARAERAGPRCRLHLAGADRARIDESVHWWRELDAEVAEYLRKSDYRFRDEVRGPEQSAPWRVVQALSGDRGLPPERAYTAGRPHKEDSSNT